MNPMPYQPETWLGKLLFDLGRILGAIRQTFRPRYVKFLEREVERLRTENTALWNSLVGTAGVPPPTLPDQPEARAGKVPAHPQRMSWPQYLRWKERQDADEHRKKLAELRRAVAAKSNGEPQTPEAT